MNKRDVFIAFLFLLIAIVAYWQIAWPGYCLKYDMIDCSYPWRFIVGEHLQNGSLPLWNPYQNFGYPLFADLQSGSSWYLPVWVIGSTWGYTIYTLSAEFIFHIFMAGLGMYYLCRTLNLSYLPAFFGGLAYMLSGFFTGHAQHFTIIAAATWLPFLLSGYIKVIKEGGIQHILKTALIVFLFISGGYPTIVVSTAYLLLLFFVFYVIFLIKRGEVTGLKVFLKRNAYLFLVSVVLLSVVIVSVLDVLPEITRTEGLDASKALLNPFSTQSFVSFLLPFATVKDPAFLGTDISMANAYVGFITLVFLVASVFVCRSKMYFIILLTGILALLIAVGDLLPFRKLLYDYIPLMNMFRFPAVFRLFTVIAFVLCAAMTFQYFINQNFDRTKILKIVIGVFAVLLVGFIIVARAQGYLEMKQFLTADLFSENDSSKLIQHKVFQAVVQMVLLLSVIILLLFVKNKKYIAPLLILASVFDMTLAVRLNAPYTVYYDHITQKEVAEHHKQNFVTGFPTPEIHPTIQNSNAALSYGPFWRNVTVFHKQISAQGFTSQQLRNHRNMTLMCPQLTDSIQKMPPVFLTQAVFPFSTYNPDSAYAPEVVFAEDSLIKYLPLQLTAQDTKAVVSIDEFTPASATFSYTSEYASCLVFQQTYYKGWQAITDSSPTQIIEINKSLIGVFAPAGMHKIDLVFRKSPVKIAFFITAGSLLLLCIMLIFLKIKHIIKK